MTLSTTGSFNIYNYSSSNDSSSLLTQVLYLTGSFTGSVTGSLITTYVAPTATPVPPTLTPTPVPATATPTPIPVVDFTITSSICSFGSSTITISGFTGGESGTYERSTLVFPTFADAIGASSWSDSPTPPYTYTTSSGTWWAAVRDKANTALRNANSVVIACPTAVPTAVPTATPTAAPTLTPTPVPATATPTPIPQIEFTITSSICSNGISTITISSFTGGETGTYERSSLVFPTFADAIGTSTWADSPTPPYTYTTSSGTWWAAVRDKGNIALRNAYSVVIACPTAEPTAVPTATPTAAPTLTPTPVPATATPTPIPAVEFSITSSACSNGQVTVTISSFTGGESGTYERSNVLYNSQAGALAPASWTDSPAPPYTYSM